jgi:hypothetical protein
MFFLDLVPKIAKTNLREWNELLFLNREWREDNSAGFVTRSQPSLRDLKSFHSQPASKPRAILGGSFGADPQHFPQSFAQ